MAQPALRTDRTEPSPLVASALLVDGDSDTRTLYRAVFEPFVATFLEAEDGAEALGMAIRQRPDLVITETRLRRIDGFALCSLLRRDPLTHEARIIVITSAATPADRARAENEGADAVLVKPCDLGEMVAALRRLCEAPRERPGAPTATASSQPAPRPLRSSIKSHAYERHVTTTPPEPPPQMFCPACATSLVYANSHIGGVSEKHPEQWDYFTCAKCGTFRYRHRTRKLTLTDDAPLGLPLRS